MRKIIYFLLVTFVLCGCVSMSIKSVNLYRDDLKFQPKDPKSVRIFHRPPKDRNFIEIGEVTVESAQWDIVEKALKLKAAELGGDAAYIIKDLGNFVAGITIQRVTAVVIKYKD